MNVPKLLKSKLYHSSKVKLLLSSVFRIKGHINWNEDGYFPIILSRHNHNDDDMIITIHNSCTILCSHLFKADGNSYTSVYGSEVSLNNMMLEQFSLGLKCVKLVEDRVGRIGDTIKERITLSVSGGNYSVIEHRGPMDGVKVACIDLDEFDGSDLHLEFLNKNMDKILSEYHDGFEVSTEKPEYVQFKESLVDFFTGKVLSGVKTENIARYNELLKEDKYNLFNKILVFAENSLYKGSNKDDAFGMKKFFGGKSKIISSDMSFIFHEACFLNKLLEKEIILKRGNICLDTATQNKQRK